LGLHVGEAALRLRRFARRVRRPWRRRRHRNLGVFAVAAVGGTPGLLEGNPGQLLYQIYGIAATLAWSGRSGVVTFLLLKGIAFFVPLRVGEQAEVEGLDVTQHGEALQ
jgi:Amt family ammonium transporter